MGRGMGQGRGMGRGMGCGRGMGPGQVSGTAQGGEGRGGVQGAGSADEIALLRHQADALGDELAKIKERIRQLEKR